MSETSQELLSSSSLTAFPFRDDCGVPAQVSRLFCDALACVPYGEALSSSISGVSVSGGALSFVLSSNGKDEGLSIDSSEGGHYALLRHSDLSSVVVDLDHVRDSEDFSDDGSYPLSPSCASYDCRSVRSFSIMNSPDGTSAPVVTASGIVGDVTFVAGTNMSVSASEDGLLLEASPGAGEGTVPCECDDEEDRDGAVVVPASTGDVVIEGDGCIQVSTDNSSTVTLGGRCTACCPTDKYVEQLESLASANAMLAKANAAVMEAVGRYNADVTDFNEAVQEPLESEFAISVTAAAPLPREKSDGWSNERVLGRHQQAFVAANVVNASQKAVRVRLADPTCTGMLLRRVAISLGTVVGDDGQPEERVVLPDANNEFDLESGGSASVYAVFDSGVLVRSMSPGRYTAVVSATFRWRGKTKVETPHGLEYVEGDKSVERTSSATFVVARGSS